MFLWKSVKLKTGLKLVSTTENRFAQKPILTSLITRGTWSISRGKWSVTRGTWSITRGTWSVTRGMWSITRGTWSITRSVTKWLSGKIGAFRLEGRRFESHSSCYAGTLGKSFTRSACIMWCGALHGCLAVKFYSCNNLLSSVNTMSVMHTASVTVWDIKNTKIIIIIIIIITRGTFRLTMCQLKTRRTLVLINLDFNSFSFKTDHRGNYQIMWFSNLQYN